MAIADFIDQQSFYEISTFIYDSGVLIFLLVFTLVYAILQKTKLLGEELGTRKKYNFVIALIMGLMVIVPHYTGDYPPGLDVVDIINHALPQVSLLAIAFITMLIIMGVLGSDVTWMGGAVSGWLSLIAFIFLLGIFGGQVGWWENFLYWIDDETLAMLIIIAVFAMVVGWITSEPSKKGTAEGMREGFENIGKMFGGNR